jgi:tetratricopeptide (TPR) repeat protein
MTSGIRIATVARKIFPQFIAASAFGLALVWLVGVGKCQAPQQGDPEASGLKNGGFEELDAAELPMGWLIPAALKTAGYRLSIDKTNPVEGKNSALFDSTNVTQANIPFGNLMQSIDARPYRGKRVRFRAAVRTAALAGDARAQLWFRVDRASADGKTAVGAFDNMQDRPIRDDQWKHFEIVGQIDDDAARIHLGMLLLGTGKAWIDDATLEVVSEATPTTGVRITTTADGIPKGYVPTPGDGRGPESDLLALFPWTQSVAAAREAALAGNKLVLACVRAHYDDKTNYSEQILLAAGLADPDVRALILARFVPVRFRYSAIDYSLVHTGRNVPFVPLRELGTTLKDAKAPALVVATADGKVVATLQSIGTFDRDLFLRYLLESLTKANVGQGDEKDSWKLLARGELDAADKAFAGMENREGRYGQARVASLRGDHQAALALCLPLAQAEGAYRHEATVQAAHALVRLGRFAEAEPILREAAGSDGTRSAEAGYLLGCVLDRGGYPTKATEAWRAVITKYPRSPDAVRAQARLTWPEAIATYEVLTVGSVPPGVTRTEIDQSLEEDQAVRRGVGYLLANQRPDGSWTSASHTEMYRVAITSLAARALHRWSAKLGGDLGPQARAASEKATGLLNQEIARANPETCNSFGAAYLLDYFVDLEESKAAIRGNTNAAVALLLGGQCPNGAWSYDLRFDKLWKGGFGGWPVTDQGRTHSINTGPALLALARAKDAGFAVDPKALEAGQAVLLKMRGTPGVYTYTYPVPESFKSADQCLGRGCVCEHALRRLGAVSADDLEVPITRFLRDRAELRMPVKLSAGWLPPRAVSSYFYFYAYDHAARAIADHGEKAAERLALLRDDVLKVGEADGTWVDYEAIGKPYGTAMALHILALAREANEQGEGKP